MTIFRNTAFTKQIMYNYPKELTKSVTVKTRITAIALKTKK